MTRPGGETPAAPLYPSCVASDDARVRDRVRALVRQAFSGPLASLADDQPLYGEGGAGLGSLEVFELIQAIEDEYGIAVGDDAVERMNSVDAIVAYVRERSARA